MSKNSGKSRIVATLLFLLYIAVACYIMFFSEGLDRNKVSSQYRYNLVPFSEIKRFWAMRKNYGIAVTIINLLGNVVCFIPFGYLVPKMIKYIKNTNIVVVMALTFMFSLVIETIQLVLKVGAFDVDDLILNTLGGAIGYLLMKTVRFFKERKNAT